MTDTQAERLIAAIQELEKSASRFAVAAERLLASGEEARARAEKTLKGFDAERLKEMSKRLDQKVTIGRISRARR